MPSQSGPHAPSPNPSVLHGALTGGLVLVLGFAAFRIFGGAGPFLGPMEATGVIGFAMTGAAFMTIAAGVTVLRGRLPPRAASQPVDEYWKDPATVQAALLLWTVVEGGGVIASVGWMLTGNLAAMAAALLALGALVVLSPGSLAGR